MRNNSKRASNASSVAENSLGGSGDGLNVDCTEFVHAATTSGQTKSNETALVVLCDTAPIHRLKVIKKLASYKAAFKGS